MELKDLLERPINELSDEEVEIRLNLLRKMKIRPESSGKGGPTKSNKERRIEDLLKNMTKEELANLVKNLNLT